MKNLCVPYLGYKPNHITQGFHSKHQANDFAFYLCYGKPLIAMEACEVTRIATDETFDDDFIKPFMKGYGIRLTSLRNPQTSYLYWHCMQFFPVKVGQRVNQGDVVAYIGNSGYCMSGGVLVPLSDRLSMKGAHLHLEEQVNGQLVDVLKDIDFSIQPKSNVKDAAKETIRVMTNFILNRK